MMKDEESNANATCPTDPRNPGWFRRQRDQHSKIVANGTWLYDRSIPRRITILAIPVEFATSRYDFDEDDQPTGPVRSPPQTEDGFVYFVRYGVWGEFSSLSEAKAAIDSQPWGPATWDE